MSLWLHRFFTVSALLCFVASGAWATVAISSGNGRIVWNVLLHQAEPIEISGGRVVAPTCGYSLCASRAGIELLYTDVTPVRSREAGRDLKPLAVGFDPSIERVFALPMLALIGICCVSALLLVGDVVVRLKRRRARGFAVEAAGDPREAGDASSITPRVQSVRAGGSPSVAATSIGGGRGRCRSRCRSARSGCVLPSGG